MTGTPALFDVVALVTDLPAWHLRRGQVGTVVEILSAEVVEVDFSDNAGRTYASAAVPTRQLLTLHHTAAGA